MKSLLIAACVSGASFLVTGCSTPAYTGGLPTIHFPEERASGENANNVIRNMEYEFRQITDDINSALLLDPHGNLTKWNLYH
jgi:hypothetical protein